MVAAAPLPLLPTAYVILPLLDTALDRVINEWPAVGQVTMLAAEVDSSSLQVVSAGFAAWGPTSP